MGTKEFIRIICENCQYENKCSKDKFRTELEPNISTTKCDIYVKKEIKKRSFIYKNQMFKY